MLKAIIFDLDNTLIDFMKYKHVSCSAAADAMIKAGLKISKKKLLSEIYAVYKQHGVEDQRVFQKVLRKLNGKLDYRILASGITAYKKASVGVLTPYPGAKKTLALLKKKYRLAVVSDAPRMQVWLRLVAMGMDGMFDVVVAKEDTGKVKPSPRPFKKALRQLKVKPEECLMVGDNPKRDIKGAKRLGMKTCLAEYGLVIKDGRVKADMKIKTITELPKRIK